MADVPMKVEGSKYEERRNMAIAIVAAILVAGRGGPSSFYDVDDIAAEAASLYFAVQRVFRV